jgi:YVTN family beta-propeller protein
VKRIRWCFIFLLSFSLSGCLPTEFVHRVPLPDEGQVILYLQPMPQQAHRLHFIIQEISAIREDGIEIPLFLSIDQIRAADLVGIQKRLAWAFVPRGSYAGISMRFGKAWVQGEEGESNLFVPEAPVVVEHPFSISPRQTSTFFLSLSAESAVTHAIRFSPVFTLAPSARELTRLTGYVSNPYSNLILVFNKRTMEVVGSISTGRGPRGMSLDQNRGKAYVALSQDSTVELIDVFEGQVVGKARLRPQDNPVDLALTADGNTLVSVNRGSNSVSILDAISLFEIERIAVGEGPTSVVIDPSGFRAYVMNTRSNTISVVDLTQRRLSLNLSVEGGPLMGAFNRAGDRLYVVGSNSPYLTVVDASQLVVTDRILIGIGAVSVEVDTLNDLVLVGKKVGGNILVVDPVALMPIDAIPVEGTGAFMKIDFEERNLFVVIPDRKVLKKVNLTSKKMIAQIEVAEGAYEVVVMGE